MRSVGLILCGFSAFHSNAAERLGLAKLAKRSLVDPSCSSGPRCPDGRWRRIIADGSEPIPLFPAYHVGCRVVLCNFLMPAILGLLPSAPAAADSKSQSVYEIAHGGLSLPMEQCTLTAAEIVLRRYDIAYDLATIKKHLRCTLEGGSLLDLQRVLQAHCCRIESYKKADAPQLQAFLESGSDHLALLVMAEARTQHVAILSAAPRTGEFYLIDFPRGPRLASLKEVGGYLSRSDGAVMYVRPAARAPESKEGPRPSDLLKVAPSTVELGKLSGDEKARKIEVELANMGDTPLALMGIASPCSCTKVELSNVWFEPKERKRATIQVFPERWPPGKNTRTVSFHLADRTAAVVKLTGEGPLRSVRKAMAIPETLLFRQGRDRSSMAKEVRVLIPGRGVRGQKAKIDTDVAGIVIEDVRWSEPKKHEDISTLVFNVTLGPSPASSRSSDPLKGSITVQMSQLARAMKIPLLVERPACVTIVPAFWMIRVREGKAAEASIKVLAIDKTAEHTIIGVDKPDWVECTYPSTFKNQAVMRLRGAQVPTSLPGNDQGLLVHVRKVDGSLEQRVRIPIGIW